MIPLLFCLAFLFLALPGTIVPALVGVADDTAPALVGAFLRLAFAALATALILLVERVGRHRDFR